MKLSSPLHLHKCLSGAYTGILAAVPTCTGECRLVRVIRVLHASRTRTDRKITDLNWACGSGPGPGAVIGPGRGGSGQVALVMVTSKPRAWIWRMWLRIFRSVSVRVW